MKKRIFFWVLPLLLVLINFGVLRAQGESYIIVHAVNPEGVEIASIEGVEACRIQIYDGDVWIGCGISREEECNRPIAISPGAHTIKVEFNGITLERNIDLEPGETERLTFVFPRTEYDIPNLLNYHDFISRTESFSRRYGCTYKEEETFASPGGYLTIFRYISGRDWDGDYNAYIVMDLTSDSYYADSEVELHIDYYDCECWYNFFCGINVATWLTCPIETTANLPNCPFEYWYLQSEASEGFPQCSFRLEGLSYTLASPTRRINIKMPAIEKSGVYFQIWTTGGYERNAYGGWGCKEPDYYDVHEFDTINASASIKMSSVPYDLLGTGLRCEEGQPPVASFTYFPGQPTVGEAIAFNASSSCDPDGSIVRYDWDFGDGGFAEGQIVNYVYNKTGQYVVTLIVTDNDNLTDVAELSLIVKGKEFMVTFDDGPIPGQTDSILLQLKKCKVNGEPVKAVFFMIGDPNPLYYAPYDFEWDKGSVLEHPDSVNRVYGLGHLVGNHTQHHAWFPQWLLFDFDSMKDFVKDEISKCNSEITKALGKKPPKIFRAPYLQQKDYPAPIYEAAGQLGFTVVGGEVADISDWLSPSVTDVEEKAKAILESWEEDEPRVLVFHDNRSVTYNHIGEIISYLQNEGYTLAHFDPGRIPKQTQPSGAGIKEVLSGISRCPVDLLVNDPEGLILSKEQNQIPDALYKEIDVDEDGELDDFFVIPEKKLGQYLIQVIPEPGISPTDTYSLEVAANGILVTLAQDVQVTSIPAKPYIVRSTESQIIPVIPVTIDFGPDTLNLKGSGKCVTVYIELPVGHGYAVSDIDVGSILLESLFEVQRSDVQDGVLMVKFNRQDVASYIDIVLGIEPPADVTLMVSGELNDGTAFEGSDTITVIDKGKNKESKGMSEKSKGKNKKSKGKNKK